MKQGSTYNYVVKLNTQKEIDYVIFRFKSRTKTIELEPITPTYDNICVIPLTQEITKDLSSFKMEAQIVFKDKDVKYSDIRAIAVKRNLGTTIIDGNKPSGFDEEIVLEVLKGDIGVVITDEHTQELIQTVADMYDELNQNKANKTELIELDDKKADKTELEDAVNTINQNKADKTEVEALDDSKGDNLALDIDATNYILTMKLRSGSTVLDSKSIDLPLESMVVDVTYDKTTKTLTFTLQNGTTVECNISDIVSGLVTQAAFDAFTDQMTDLLSTKQDVLTLGMNLEFRDGKLQTVSNPTFESVVTSNIKSLNNIFTMGTQTVNGSGNTGFIIGGDYNDISGKALGNIIIGSVNTIRSAYYNYLMGSANILSGSIYGTYVFGNDNRVEIPSGQYINNVYIVGNHNSTSQNNKYLFGNNLKGAGSYGQTIVGQYNNPDMNQSSPFIIGAGISGGARRNLLWIEDWTVRGYTFSASTLKTDMLYLGTDYIYHWSDLASHVAGNIYWSSYASQIANAIPWSNYTSQIAGNIKWSMYGSYIGSVIPWSNYASQIANAISWSWYGSKIYSAVSTYMPTIPDWTWYGKDNFGNGYISAYKVKADNFQIGSDGAYQYISQWDDVIQRVSLPTWGSALSPYINVSMPDLPNWVWFSNNGYIKASTFSTSNNIKITNNYYYDTLGSSISAWSAVGQYITDMPNLFSIGTKYVTISTELTLNGAGITNWGSLASYISATILGSTYLAGALGHWSYQLSPKFANVDLYNNNGTKTLDLSAFKDWIVSDLSSANPLKPQLKAIVKEVLIEEGVIPSA